MPHKRTSSDPALESSVAILRDSMGPAVAGAFVVAPLWIPGVGCIGLVTLADIPYSRPPRAARRGRNGMHARSRASSECPYVVGAGVVESARRVGLALGVAVHRTRKRALVTAIRAGGAVSDRGSGASEHQARTIASPSKGKREGKGTQATPGRR